MASRKAPATVEATDGNGGPFDWFHALWDSIHGEGAWKRNDWVWALTFRRLP